ncbi:MAG: class A beta-lactamase-related serine hydrolase [Chloroflexi bacterium]|nr:MAG: class A beta-lactamase-related serine hydrolase [Chloroflexota bacterium]
MATSTTGHVAIEATPESVGMSSSRLANVTRLVQRYIDDGKYAGAITLVARRDKVVHFETYGKLDAEAGTSMRPDAIFRLASMTKPIVSVALMSLYEEGRFQLDTPVYEFIPAFRDVQVLAGGTADAFTTRPPARAITVADLLRHTAGFEFLGGDSPVVGELYRRAGITGIPATGTLAERAAALARMPLVGDPGAQFTYHYATDVVGHLCELLAGQPLDVFLRARILQPLGMRDTAFHVSAANRDRLAGWYDQANDGDARFRAHDPADEARYAEGATYFSAGGGLTATTADYLRFTRMLARGGELDGERILGTRTLALMASNHLPGGRDLDEMWFGGPGPTAIARGTGFGLGFAVLLDPARAALLGTPGEFYWGGAYSTAFFVSPAEDLIMIFMTQLGGSDYLIRRQLRVATYQAIID